MEIAAEHSESQRIGTGQDVKKRFLLGRVTSESGDVIRRHAQVATFIEPDLADTAFTLFDQTPVTARVAFKRSGVEVFGEFGRSFHGHRVEDGGEGC
jgi:hypothetical protein